MSDLIREWGIKLILTKIKMCKDPHDFFYQTQIKPWNCLFNATNGLKVYDNVLWMRLLEVSEGIKLPNGCRFFSYIPFWKEVFPRGKRFYRFRSLIKKEFENDDAVFLTAPEDVTKRPWIIYGWPSTLSKKQ